MRFELFL